MVNFGIWEGSTIQISINGLSLGSYNFILYVYDTSGNSANDLVIVNVVDTTDSTVSEPDDVQFKQGETGYNVAWMLYDVNPYRYELFNGVILLDSGTWNSSGESIVVSFDGLTVGQYYFTIYLYDLANNGASDMVIVIVLPSDAATSTTTTTTITDSPLVLILGIGIGVCVVISVIVLVVLKKR